MRGKGVVGVGGGGGEKGEVVQEKGGENFREENAPS